MKNNNNAIFHALCFEKKINHFFVRRTSKVSFVGVVLRTESRFSRTSYENQKFSFYAKTYEIRKKCKETKLSISKRSTNFLMTIFS